MKDNHGRIARWFALLDENEFETCYKLGKQNSTEDYLSSTVLAIIIVQDLSIEDDLEIIAKSTEMLPHLGAIHTRKQN